MTPTLTAKMRAALHELRKQPARRIHNPALPGKPPWPHHPSTLAALVRHELVERDKTKNAKRLDVDIWTITNAGRAALEPIERFREEKPLYLGNGSVRYRKLPSGRWTVDDATTNGDYTTDARQSIDHDQGPAANQPSAVAAVQPADLAQFTDQARTREHARQRERARWLDNQSLTDRIDNLERVAHEHRVNISRELRLIRHMLTTERRRRHALERIERLESGLGQRAA